MLSAFAGLNGLLLSLYFACAPKKNKLATYFLSGLLFVVSLRVIKSVFLYFNPNLSGIIIQIGLSACTLIGPFLYLYIKTWRYPENNTKWLFHVLPITIVFITLGILYPYVENRIIWSDYIVKAIYLTWLLYIIFSGLLLRPVLSKFFVKKPRFAGIEIWMLSLFFGISIIWIGYNLGAYTSYIVGGVSSSFVFYLLLVFWVLKSKNTKPFFEEHVKYGNKKIEPSQVEETLEKLNQLLVQEKLYKNADLKIGEVAKKLRVTPHFLSQILNDNLGNSFSSHINTYRIEAAKDLLLKEPIFTTEAIGYQCGFNSKSNFYAVFKKITELTPSAYRSENQAS